MSTTNDREPDLTPRISRTFDADSKLAGVMNRLIRVSTAGLPMMYWQDRRVFCHTRRLRQDGSVPMEGISLRYSAIVLLGGRHLPESDQQSIFGGLTAVEYAGLLVDQLDSVDNLGDVALVTWAAAELHQPKLPQALKRLDEVWSAVGNEFTVEVAWVLSAYAAASFATDTRDRASQVFQRLSAAYSPGARVFPHWLDPSSTQRLRAHVACFADQVYPIQAFARYHNAFDSSQALSIADQCAGQICALQGDAGQWWWHYDSRTGGVVEGYPVYSVHQDAMAPMCLLDLMDAGGTDFSEAIRLGVEWMDSAQEIGQSLIDEERSLIWRKVGRREPGKLSRAARSVLTSFHPSLKLNFLSPLVPPTRVDWESRPYHLGWILHAWLGGLDS